MLEFERLHPEEAAKAVAEHNLRMMNPSKPTVVSLNQQDVETIHKNGRFVPLDTVELLKIDAEKERYEK